MSDVRDPLSLPHRRILVVAPHQDDESLGCGGLIAALAADGRALSILFVTDGGASHRNSPTWPRARLATQREQEAEEALVRLGAASAPRIFLRLPDAAMPPAGTPAHAAALARVTELVRAFEPDLVILPWRRDPHSDHRDAWLLTTQALSAAGLDPERLEYAVWLDELGHPDDHPLPGEAERVVFDIDAQVARKRAAVAAHLSQASDLIVDDPEGFRLSAGTIARLTGPLEAYWRPLQ
ncbi:PIG-L family deacetylase [Aurantimonas sp. MSK8Z-1]|uniref:PIG-L deacetylase family protein n=1 Tax=Mangrovibrevibacter kandeliae TaxID=2968473 RepID=UPI002117A86E|nr:PIG-L family deacetylase [Aurantimonas sp. MSK8Z-1]MCW4115763.1 PIG-L family deacetylase [Aurantimonas sp. MSK8Z-1]